MQLQKPLYLFFIFVLVSVSIPSQARIICWTNKDGVKECGDRLPPEYAQKDRQELNEQGLVIEETERAKTEEELAAMKEQAALDAEKQKLEEERALQDRILIETFTNVEDINMARDGKLSAIETSINLAEKRNEKLQSDLDKLVEEAAAEERAGKTAPEHLVKDIETLRRQISNNNDFIAGKRSEQEQVTQEYAKSAERFKELKGIE